MKKLLIKKSQNLLNRLLQVESPDITYISEDYPIVIRKAKGIKIEDVDANQYIDFTSCFGVLALGHQNKTLKKTIVKQASQLIHGMGDVLPSVSKIKLLEKLNYLVPIVDSKAILGLNGSDAIEAALKTAMLVTKKHKFISFSGGYHGLNFGALSLASRDHFKQGFEQWLENKNIIIPFPIDNENFSKPFSCVADDDNVTKYFFNDNLLDQNLVLEQAEHQLKTEKIAAIFIEPVQGRGGDRIFAKECLQNIKYLCQKYKALLVFDEIFTGFGRTGRLFAQQLSNVEPDIMCVGKSLGGGLPLSACLSNYFDVWGKSSGEARHTSTFLGHPLACALGCTVIDEIEKNMFHFQNNLLDINKEYEFFVKTAYDLCIYEKFPFIIRGSGFMRGIWFYKNTENIAVKLTKDLLYKGFIVLPSGNGNVLSLTPPFIMKPIFYRKLFVVILELLKSY